jgi:glycosyltransferase involved in cell wall biosynthesis
MVEADLSYEVIVVDDHSTDQTRRAVQSLAKHYPVTFYQKIGKKGMGYSVLEAVPKTSYEYVAIMDADGRYAPEHLPQLLDLAAQHGFAVANREKLRVGLFERFVGRVLLGLSEDTYSGLKVFKREIFSHLDPHLISAWVIDAPLVYTALEHGYPGSHISIPYIARARARSLPSTLSRLGSRLWGTLKTRWYRSSFHQIVEVSSLGSGVVFNRK